MVVPRTWCMLKWKRAVYDMSVANILSDVNCLQMIFDLANNVLEWTNASSELDLMRCIFHSKTLSNRINFPLVRVLKRILSTLIMSKNCAHSVTQNFLWSILYLRHSFLVGTSWCFPFRCGLASFWQFFFSRTILEYIIVWHRSPKLK